MLRFGTAPGVATTPDGSLIRSTRRLTATVFAEPVMDASTPHVSILVERGPAIIGYVDAEADCSAAVLAGDVPGSVALPGSVGIIVRRNSLCVLHNGDSIHQRETESAFPCVISLRQRDGALDVMLDDKVIHFPQKLKALPKMRIGVSLFRGSVARALRDEASPPAPFAGALTFTQVKDDVSISRDGCSVFCSTAGSGCVSLSAQVVPAVAELDVTFTSVRSMRKPWSLYVLTAQAAARVESDPSAVATTTSVMTVTETADTWMIGIGDVTTSLERKADDSHELRVRFSLGRLSAWCAGAPIAAETLSALEISSDLRFGIALSGPGQLVAVSPSAHAINEDEVLASAVEDFSAEGVHMHAPLAYFTSQGGAAVGAEASIDGRGTSSSEIFQAAARVTFSATFGSSIGDGGRAALGIVPATVIDADGAVPAIGAVDGVVFVMNNQSFGLLQGPSLVWRGARGEFQPTMLIRVRVADGRVAVWINGERVPAKFTARLKVPDRYRIAAFLPNASHAVRLSVSSGTAFLPSDVSSDAEMEADVPAPVNDDDTDRAEADVDERAVILGAGVMADGASVPYRRGETCAWVTMQSGRLSVVGPVATAADNGLTLASAQIVGGESQEGVTCDGCSVGSGGVTFSGNRWKCPKCPDVDLCDACVKCFTHYHDRSKFQCILGGPRHDFLFRLHLAGGNVAIGVCDARDAPVAASMLDLATVSATRFGSDAEFRLRILDKHAHLFHNGDLVGESEFESAVRLMVRFSDAAQTAMFLPPVTVPLGARVRIAPWATLHKAAHDGLTPLPSMSGQECFVTDPCTSNGGVEVSNDLLSNVLVPLDALVVLAPPEAPVCQMWPEGARVVRNPNQWRCGNADFRKGNPAPGVVVLKPTPPAPGHIWVRWANGVTQQHAVGAGGVFEVERALAVGARVVRTCMWTRGDADGHGPGTLVDDSDNRLLVKFDAGVAHPVAVTYNNSVHDIQYFEDGCQLPSYPPRVFSKAASKKSTALAPLVTEPNAARSAPPLVFPPGYAAPCGLDFLVALRAAASTLSSLWDLDVGAAIDAAAVHAQAQYLSQTGRGSVTPEGAMSIAVATAPALAEKFASALRGRDPVAVRLLRPLLWHLTAALSELQEPLGQPCYRVADCPTAYFTPTSTCRWATTGAVQLKLPQTSLTILQLRDAQISDVTHFSSDAKITHLIHPLAKWVVVETDTTTVALKQAA